MSNIWLRIILERLTVLGLRISSRNLWLVIRSLSSHSIRCICSHLGSWSVARRKRRLLILHGVIWILCYWKPRIGISIITLEGILLHSNKLWALQHHVLMILFDSVFAHAAAAPSRDDHASINELSSPDEASYYGDHNEQRYYHYGNTHGHTHQWSTGASCCHCVIIGVSIIIIVTVAIVIVVNSITIDVICQLSFSLRVFILHYIILIIFHIRLTNWIVIVNFNFILDYDFS